MIISLSLRPVHPTQPLEVESLDLSKQLALLCPNMLYAMCYMLCPNTKNINKLSWEIN